MESIEFPASWAIQSNWFPHWISTSGNASASAVALAAKKPHHVGWLGCGRSDGWGPLSNKYNDFTPCFLQGVLYLAVAVFMIAGGLYQLGVLSRRKPMPAVRVTWGYYAKLVVAAMQIAFSIVLVFRSHAVGIIHSALVANVAAVIVAFALHYVEQMKSTIPNGVLLFFWLFHSVLDAGRWLNLYLRDSVSSKFGHFTILSLVASIVMLVLEMAVPLQRTRIDDLHQSPFDKANVFSRITFNWMGGLMRSGYEHYLTENDLPALPEELKSHHTAQEFADAYYGQKTSQPSLFWAIAKSFGLPFILGGLFKAMQDMLAFVQPQLLRLLIKFVNDYSESRNDPEGPIPLTRGYMIAFAMFVVSVTQTTCLHQYFQRAFDLGMKIKTSLTSVIYDKALVLSNETRQESTTGDIVNLMSVDVQRLQDLVQNLQIIWSGPFQIILCLYSLHGLLGNSMWAGVFIMIIMIPLNAVIARYQKKLQRSQMKFKDERSRLISEILNNIKSLKLYAWESPYLDKLNFVRNEKELRNLKKMGVFSAFSNFTWSLAPFLVSCLTFAVFVWTQKRALTTDLVFPALSLFNLLSFPLAIVPMVITNIVEAQVAISRLTKFLNGAELQSDAVTHAPAASKQGDVAVTIKNGTFLWSKAKGDQNYKVALSNITFKAKKGDLHCVVGRVGSGKSSLIQAILGDLYKLDGDVTIHGKVAYVSQVPWIMNGTIKDNVLFGHRYDPEFYSHVIKACALSVDLAILPKGDATEVGEKGISLSGGQKARLSLARAVYARADVYLLDDPLSAVDEHVGRHLRDHVLGPHGLLKSKCKVLATNNIKVLSVADTISMISDGRIIESGTYEEVLKQETSKLYQLITEFGGKESKDNSRDVTPSPSVSKDKTNDPVAKISTDMERSSTPASAVIDPNDLESDVDFDAVSLRRASEVPLDEIEALRRETAEQNAEDADARARREHMEQGQVKWDVYKAYAQACNPTGVAVFLSCTIISMALSVSSNVWLKHWSEINTEHGYNPDVPKYLGIYFLLGIGFSAAVLTQTCVMWILCTIHGSRKLHNDMAFAVLRAPMSFFETTPIGRVLNRFSQDIYKIDEVLGRVFGMFFSNSSKVVFTIGVICFSTPPFVFMILPLGVLYVYYQQYYLKTSRELRRLDSVSKSPIFANFQESLNGVSVIRAYGQVNRFKVMNELQVDKNMRAYHPSINANRWLAVRLEFLGSIIILGAAGFAIFGLRTGHLSAGLVGLSVSYALQITQSLNWIVRMTVEVETNIVSVERVLEYSALTPEAPDIIEGHRPSKGWPQQGEIVFKDYSTRYRPELDLVLKRINLSIKPHEKVGIVGRTGAGKSSMTLALFRIIEKSTGSIQIDSLETSTIGLADLRHSLSIIPQDSQVFEGSIRSNLDPTNEYSDTKIWKALELAHLKDHVLKMYDERDPDSEIASALEARVSEGGSNLSIGQRQLMCLARVLLKMNTSNVLVLDEATAAVDVETDKILQQTIRNEFKDKTIITIAHRLNTILDSDRIIVLESGEVAEFDTPQNLLQKKDSLFYSLAQQGGFVEETN
ncbi:metal resistance protein Ycf1p [Diutina catenulata]